MGADIEAVMPQKYTEKECEMINAHLSERAKRTLEHFGYDEPIGAAFDTRHNKDAFKNLGYVLSNHPIDERFATRIVIDYDPRYEHCLMQISQTSE